MIPESVVVGGTLSEKIVTVTGTVQQMDLETRQVTLLGPGGTKLKIALAPDVDDVEGIEQGDQVDLTYRESIAFQVKKPDQAKPGVAHSTDVTPAPRGEDLGGCVTDTFNFRAPIAAIDKAASAVTVRNPRGDITVVKVPDPSALDAVAVGDVMDIAFTAAFAITVRKSAPMVDTSPHDAPGGKAPEEP